MKHSKPTVTTKPKQNKTTNQHKCSHMQLLVNQICLRLVKTKQRNERFVSLSRITFNLELFVFLETYCFHLINFIINIYKKFELVNYSHELLELPVFSSFMLQIHRRKPSLVDKKNWNTGLTPLASLFTGTGLVIVDLVSEGQRPSNLSFVLEVSVGRESQASTVTFCTVLIIGLPAMCGWLR